MSERNHNRRYDPYKDPRNNLRGIDREELEEWRQWQMNGSVREAESNFVNP